MPASLSGSGPVAASAESAPSTSGMTGPLSKRLRTLHSLQQQKQSDQKDDNDEALTPGSSSASAQQESFLLPSTSHHSNADNNSSNNNNHNSDDSDQGDQVIEKIMAKTEFVPTQYLEFINS